ncbi:MAG: class I SAM-dependent methyltransferase [Desulfuromonadaceae bacterium]|nr:class I SAM-dependent methyltransferase [Desulfuromonadaceae bacterium]
MEISADQLGRLVSFIDKIESETYPETPTFMHSEITGIAIDNLISMGCINTNSHILDIGCGQGPALDLFRDKGYVSTVGITLNNEDVRICQEKGHNAYKMDQSFLEFPDASFNLLWARHVIEHSIFPFFTLSEFARVMVPGGTLYLEVPAPETSCHHETNPNHYSVLGHGAWISLLRRCGFTLRDEGSYSFLTPMGPDEYWGFICTKNK